MNLLIILTIFASVFSVHGREMLAKDPNPIDDISSAYKISKFGLKQAQSLCLDEINEQRNNNGLGNLNADERLEAGAHKHNEWMIQNDCFDHQCPGEPSLGERISNEGYEWSGAAENIANGQEDCPQVVDSWMNSAGHRANILGDYKDIGCDKMESKWTCKFASSW